MAGRVRLVTVRLDDSELAELRKQPGESDAARLRSLLHGRGLNDDLSATISAEVNRRLTVAVATDGAITRKVVMNLAEQINKLLATRSVT